MGIVLCCGSSEKPSLPACFDVLSKNDTWDAKMDIDRWETIWTEQDHKVKREQLKLLYKAII